MEIERKRGRERGRGGKRGRQGGRKKEREGGGFSGPNIRGLNRKMR